MIPLYLAIWLVTELHFGEYSSAYWLMVFASCIVMLKFSARIEGCGRAFSVAEYLYVAHANELSILETLATDLDIFKKMR